MKTTVERLQVRGWRRLLHRKGPVLLCLGEAGGWVAGGPRRDGGSSHLCGLYPRSLLSTSLLNESTNGCPSFDWNLISGFLLPQEFPILLTPKNPGRKAPDHSDSASSSATTSNSLRDLGQVPSSPWVSASSSVPGRGWTTSPRVFPAQNLKGFFFFLQTRFSRRLLAEVQYVSLGHREVASERGTHDALK